MPNHWQDLPGGFGLLNGHLYFVQTEDLTQGTWEMVPVSYFTNGGDYDQA